MHNSTNILFSLLCDHLCFYFFHSLTLFSTLVSSSRYRLCRYEDIVLDPGLSAKLMYNFSGLVLSTKTLQHILSKELSSNKRDVLLNQNILFKPWRSSMTLKDVNVISEAYEDTLSMLGYRKYFDSKPTLQNVCSMSAVGCYCRILYRAYLKCMLRSF